MSQTLSKIAIGFRRINGPFGGGNQFATALSNYLVQQGVQVFYDLSQPDLDLILLTDPRTYIRSNAFGPQDVLDYLSKVNPRALVVQRINECDERKGSRTMNAQLHLANAVADSTVLIATWLQPLFEQHGFSPKNPTVLLNGADEKVFTYQPKSLPSSGKIRLVTHHWAANWFKGWDVYQHIDQLLDNASFRERFAFHYIGNPLTTYQARNIVLHAPKSGHALAAELHKNHIYVTASMNEPAGMHHIEGAMCGLPVLYRTSGALPEYCQGYGVPFSGADDFPAALEKLVAQYAHYATAMQKYPHSSATMCANYFAYFQRLLAEWDGLRATRPHYSALDRRWLRTRLWGYRVLHRLRVQ